MDFSKDIFYDNKGGVDFVQIRFNGQKYNLNVSLFNNFKTSIELYYEGKTELALDKILQHKEQSTNNSALSYTIGYLYEELGDYSKALSYYKTSNSLENLFWFDFRIGLCLYHLKQYKEAIDYYASVLKNDFSDFRDNLFQNYTLNKGVVLNNRALCYAMLGISDKCIEDCTISIELKPEYEKSYFIRGIEYFKIGLLEQAKRDIIKSDELGNSNANSILSQIVNAQAEHLEKVKSFANSIDAKKMAGGQRLTEYFIGDLKDLINENSPNNYSDLKSILKPYTKEMWIEFKKNTGHLDYFNKTFIAYEVVFTLNYIYEEIPKEVFEDIYYSILE